MEGKTVVAIAHRLSTIAAMDRLVVMDGGRIVEMGDHASLLAAGIYAAVGAPQGGGFSWAGIAGRGRWGPGGGSEPMKADQPPGRP